MKHHKKEEGNKNKRKDGGQTQKTQSLVKQGRSRGEEENPKRYLQPRRRNLFYGTS